MSRKTYEQKSKKSKELYVNYIDKIIKSGKSISQIKRMNVSQWQNIFGKHGRLKKSSLEAKKRVIIGQISKDVNKVVSDYIERQNIQNNEYKTFLYNQSYELLRTKQEKIDKVNEVNYEPIEREGQYGVMKLIDLKNEHEYYIKYHDKKSFNKKFEDLKQQYKISNFITKLLGVYMYKTEISKQFQKRLNTLNIA